MASLKFKPRGQFFLAAWDGLSRQGGRGRVGGNLHKRTEHWDPDSGHMSASCSSHWLSTQAKPTVVILVSSHLRSRPAQQSNFLLCYLIQGSGSLTFWSEVIRVRGQWPSYRWIPQGQHLVIKDSRAYVWPDPPESIWVDSYSSICRGQYLENNQLNL